MDQVISHLPESSDTSKKGETSQMDRRQVEDILGIVREIFSFDLLKK